MSDDNRHELPRNALTHLSLFTGIGGLDLAAEWTGLTTVGQCEWADFPTRVLEKHWPDVPRWRDIRTLTGESFHAKTGLRTVDVISGGFPCQPFSVAGKRRGKEDDRYLWPEMLRVIDEIRPTWVIGENVAGITSMAEPVGEPHMESRAIVRDEDQDYYKGVSSQKERMLLVGILEDLRTLGYAVQPFIVPACGVGAHHQRYRIAIVGHAEHHGSPSHTLAGSAGADGHQRAKGKKTGFKPAGAGGSENGSDVGHAERGGLPRHDRRRPGKESAVGCADVADATLKRIGRLPVQPGRSRKAGQDADWRREDVADTDTARAQGRTQAGDAHRERQKPEQHAGRCRDLGNTHSEGLQIPRHQPGYKTLLSKNGTQLTGRRTAQPRMGNPPDGLPGWLARPVDAWDCDWDSIPRIAIGVKDRVDKLKGLGNAVSPEQFYPFFYMIAGIEK